VVKRTFVVRMLAVSLIAGAIVFGGASRAVAQPEVPAKGEGTVSVTYQLYEHAGHFDRLGRKNTNGATESQILITEAEFGITNAFAVRVMLPFIASKYTGPDEYIVEGHVTHPGPLDVTRTYHGAFQDIRFEARRMFLAGPVTLTPFVGLSVPTHRYETIGEAVPGRYRREYLFGASGSPGVEAILPGVYVHARYAYATLEKTNGYPHTRSNIDLESGYDFNARIGVRGLVGWQIAHKRPTLAQLAADWVNHDRFINSSYLHVGGGMSFYLKKTTEIAVFYGGNVRGTRGAHVARVLSFTLTRSFGGSLPSL
jgi:hypothetical protein